MTLYGWLEVGDEDFYRPVAEDEEKTAELVSWLGVYGVNAFSVWKIEIHVEDGLVLRVHEYARNEFGRIYGDEKGVVKKPPYDVLIKELPPVQIRRVGVDA